MERVSYERWHVSKTRKSEVSIMNKDAEQKEIMKDMERRRTNDINFTDYAPLDKDYTKAELAEIYKKIITDIESDAK